MWILRNSKDLLRVHTIKVPLFNAKTNSVPDLPLCLGVPRWPGGGEAHLPANKFFTMDFCLCGAILNFKAFCFGAISDIMIELIVYWSVPQSRQS